MYKNKPPSRGQGKLKGELSVPTKLKCSKANNTLGMRWLFLNDDCRTNLGWNRNIGAHRGARQFSSRMVSTRAAVNQNSVAAEMQGEMNCQLEELRRKNEEELNALREEN